MKIAIFGLGYVGCVSMGCLAENGHSVIGVDINKFKVDLINSGKPTIIEKGIEGLIQRHWSEGRIEATTDYLRAVEESDVALISVGTPSLPTGQLDLEQVFKTSEQIAEGLKEKDYFFPVVIRSTVIPGTNKKAGDLIEEVSGKKREIDFTVVSNPEFLREGSAVSDYFNPKITVIGTDNQKAYEQVSRIYEKVNGLIIGVDIGIAEMIKYVNNSFHALKIAFANEVGVIAKAMGVDSRQVMELFARDTKLNISDAYLKPGMGYGGSCLPKDLRGLYSIAHDNYLETPLLKSIAKSNNIHNHRAFELIERFGSLKVGIIGLAFKTGTDDLRQSPAVELVEKLTGKGYDVKVYDRNVVLARLVGINKSYIEEKLPHISRLLTDSLDEIIEHSETLVLVHKIIEVSDFSERLKKKKIVDLAGYDDFRDNVNYEGIAW